MGARSFRIGRRATIVLGLAIVSVLVPPATADDVATVDSATTPVVFAGTAEGVVPAPEMCALAGCHGTLIQVNLPAGTWTDAGGLQIGIRWQDENQDLDLYVYDSAGSLAASSAGPVSSAESVMIPAAANGVYRILVVPTTAPEATPFEGVAEVEFATPVDPVRELRPDFRALPPRNLHFQTSAYVFELPVPSFPGGCYPEERVEQGATRCLRFDQIIANDGDGPFELRYRLDGVATESTRALTQRIYRSDGSYRERFADTYEFHAAHAHFHYKNFAQSHLWRADVAGNRLDDAPARSGRKNGFCMVDVENTGFGTKGDAARSYIPPACLLPTEVDPSTGAVSMVNGISRGWADVYNWFLADQFIDVEGLADGYYVLESVADPAATIEETDDTNNTASALILLCADHAEFAAPGTGGTCS